MRIQNKDHNRPTLEVDHCFYKVKKCTLLNPIYTSQKIGTARHGTAPCPNHFGMALPIYTTKNLRFFSYWARFQFLIGTPNFRHFFNRKMAYRQQAIILHRVKRKIYLASKQISNCYFAGQSIVRSVFNENKVEVGF